MELDDLITSKSNYLKQDDVPPGGIDVTVRGFKREDMEADGKKEQKVVLYFNELEKGLVMNLVNRELLKEATGETTVEGVKGKVVNLYTDPTVMFGGKKTGGLRLRRARAEVAPQKGTELNDDIPF
jgi:hypothetical protein